MKNNNKPQHNHNAAREGNNGEKLLRNNIESYGLNLWSKHKGRFPKHKQRLGLIEFPSPYDNGVFNSDGYIPELDIIVEYKYGTKHGTAEEKIFCDLQKIRDGVYGQKKLIYVFAGTVENPSSTVTKRCWARTFDKIAKDENLPVTVIFARLQKDGSMPGLKEALDNIKNQK